MLHTHTTQRFHGLAATDRNVGVRPPHALVAVQDDALLWTIATALELDGYSVATAQEGRQVARYLRLAFADWQGFRVPDLVVFDLDLPGADHAGIVTRLYRSDSALPVVLLSSADQRLPAAAHGAIQFTKPFDIDDLRTAALNLLPVFH